MSARFNIGDRVIFSIAIGTGMNFKVTSREGRITEMGNVRAIVDDGERRRNVPIDSLRLACGGSEAVISALRSES